MSNDVDIVFTHPAGGKDRGLCKRLVERLQGKGMITHVMRMSKLTLHFFSSCRESSSLIMYRSQLFSLTDITS